ncbi:MAG: hypothetical protein ABIJ05_02675 [Patescibacteria group bacterium]
MVENWLKQQFIIKSLIALAVFILIVIFGSLLNKEREIVIGNKVRLSELKRDLIYLDKIVVEENENREKIVLVSQTFPSNYAEVAFFAGALEKIGANQNLEIEIDKTAKEEKSGLFGLKFSLKTLGSYKSFSEMLSLLADFPYHTKFDSIEMQKTEGTISSLTTFRLLMIKK